jgi:hypothetical protein
MFMRFIKKLNPVGLAKEAIKKTAHAKLHSPDFKDDLLKEINRKIDVPGLTEAQERQILEVLYDASITSVTNMVLKRL